MRSYSTKYLTVEADRIMRRARKAIADLQWDPAITDVERCARLWRLRCEIDAALNEILKRPEPESQGGDVRDLRR